jgi:FdhD protein
VCGRRSIDDLLARCASQSDEVVVAPAAIARAFDAMRAAQPRFERTGGIHAAAACDARGAPLAVYEDVGRHNAVDKVVGALWLARRLEGAAMLLVSGRASFEVVQKAVVARIPVVASVSAASSLAIDLAERTGTTLVGFARPGRMNVYAGEARIARESG